MSVYVKGRKINPDPKRSIGRGGEAEVYDVGNGKALKVFKDEHHPDYQGQPSEQIGARERIREHQFKLRTFPKNLPARVITPEDLATDRQGQTIVGYTMPLLSGSVPMHRFAEKSFRQSGGIPAQQVVELFRSLRETVDQLHQAQVVIGDFNDLNVLVKGTDPYLIDADSFQFQAFWCQVYTTTFVDPLLCLPQGNELQLAQPHTAESDWYAFSVMLMQCLLYVGPYGGVFKPKSPSQQLPHTIRPLYHITVFHPDVRYPKPAIPYGVLSDDLLHYFHQVFEKDSRGVFPQALLENLQWTTCTICGLEHARDCCPDCLQTGVVKQVIKVRGSVVCNQIFQTDGVILFAALQKGELAWLYHDRGRFQREDGSVVLQGDLDPLFRYRLQGKATLLGKGEQVIRLSPQEDPQRLAVDAYDHLSLIDVNAKGCYWIQGGQLLRDGSLGPEYIGDVLSGQTLFWVGSQFGFGFYRAGDLNVAFVFDAYRRGLNDRVKLPAWSGQLLDSTCFLSEDRCWFFWAAQEQGRTLHRCAVITPDGSVLAHAQGQMADGSWLGALRGKCAAGHVLLAATDEGMIRLEVHNGQIVKTQEFPDTEPFVDSSCHLFPGSAGVYVVTQKRISILKMS